MSGIYIHIPFCKQACFYCDFHFSTSLQKKDAMLAALQQELVLRKNEAKGRTIETIYFGGGTPSLLSAAELLQLIQTVAKHYTLSDTPEITLEANPDDLDATTIEQLAASPVNRLSIGIQSFFEEDLKLMNRAHNAEQAKESLALARQYFDNISVDLIYGIPGQSNERWLENVTTALSYEVPHISSYALTVEPKTALASFIEKGIVEDVNDEQAQAQFMLLLNTLEEQGFIHYELSNFGKEGFFSKNNSSYWLGKPYIGIGPSAHSFDGVSRGWNVSNNALYIKALTKQELPISVEKLTVTDRYNEAVMTGLRTVWGVSLTTVEERFGVHYKKYLMQQADKYIVEHLLYLDADLLKTTKKGKFLADGIAADLFKLNIA